MSTGFRSFISPNSSRAACNLDREIFLTRKRNRSIQMSSVCFPKQPQSNLHPHREIGDTFERFIQNPWCGPHIICCHTKVSCCRWRLPFSIPNNFSMSKCGPAVSCYPRGLHFSKPNDFSMSIRPAVICCPWRLHFSKPNNFSMSRCGPAVSCYPCGLLFPNQISSQCLGVGLLSAVIRVGSFFQTK